MFGPAQGFNERDDGLAGRGRWPERGGRRAGLRCRQQESSARSERARRRARARASRGAPGHHNVIQLMRSGDSNKTLGPSHKCSGRNSQGFLVKTNQDFKLLVFLAATGFSGFFKLGCFQDRPPKSTRSSKRSRSFYQFSQGLASVAFRESHPLEAPGKIREAPKSLQKRSVLMPPECYAHSLATKLACVFALVWLSSDNISFDVFVDPGSLNRTQSRQCPACESSTAPSSRRPRI